MTYGERAAAIIFFVCGIFLGGLGSLLMGDSSGREMVMNQAYDRGYAVQCVGKEGYYWECKE